MIISQRTFILLFLFGVANVLSETDFKSGEQIITFYYYFCYFAKNSVQFPLPYEFCIHKCNIIHSVIESREKGREEKKQQHSITRSATVFWWQKEISSMVLHLPFQWHLGFVFHMQRTRTYSALVFQCRKRKKNKRTNDGFQIMHIRMVLNKCPRESTLNVNNMYNNVWKRPLFEPICGQRRRTDPNFRRNKNKNMSQFNWRTIFIS